MKRWMAIGMAAALTATVSEGAYVVLKGGQRREVASIRARPDGGIVLIGADGSRMELSRDQYVQAVADKPAKFDQAVAMVNGGKFDAAIPILTEIVRENRFLDWDRAAGVELARAHAAKGNTTEALEVYEGLMRDYPGLDADGGFMWNYRDALLGAKQFSRLETDLAKIVAGDNRADAARAHLMRGDVRAAENKTEHAIREYLRAVLFYERETEVLPKALLKTAQALEGLRDARAKDFYRRLVEDFGDSPEAAAAKGKI